MLTLRPAFCILCALVLAGCAPIQVVKNAPIDQGQKSITVPAGSAGLTGDIKRALSGAGWKTQVRRGPTVTAGSIKGGEVALATADTFKTKYALALSWEGVDYTMWKWAYRFDISVVDNQSGEEVLTMSGEKNLGASVAERFIAEMKN